MIKISLHITCEDATEQATADANHIADVICSAFKQGLQQHANNTRSIITSSVTETTETVIVEELPNEQPTPEQRELQMLRQLLVDADEVARRRGDPYGLCDSIDNSGKPYPSAACAGIIAHLHVLRVQPMLFLKDLRDAP